MIAPEDENDAEVRREDQDNINRFARLNARKHALQAELKDLQRQLEHLEDAGTELLMGNDDDAAPVLLQLGEAFIETPDEDAAEVCEEKVDKVQARVEELQDEEKTILEEQAKLKSILYGRFGKSINLEDS